MNRQTAGLVLLLACAGPSYAQNAKATQNAKDAQNVPAQTLVNPGAYRALAADHRAYRTGDLITVYVAEATRAKSQAATDASSRLDMNASLASPTTDYAATLGMGGSNSGGAQTTRTGELRTQISAQVVHVYGDGTMVIEGAQTLTVNGESQRIRLRGMVRPQDVSAENTVWSNRISNAELELDGVGVVSESQRQSVIYRLFKWLRLM